MNARPHRTSSCDVRAGAILLDAERVLRDALLCVREGRIAAVRRGLRRDGAVPLLDFSDRVLMPGLVNAHVHLELTGLRVGRPRPGRLDQWLSEVIEKKRGWTAARFRRAAERGIRLLLRSGTTAVGEIESEGASGRTLRRYPLRAFVFRELLGLDPRSAAERWAAARRTLRLARDGRLRRGLSPHAPYSVSPELLRFCSSRGRAGTRLAIHLAESPGELRFLKSGRGPFRDFLDRIGKLPAGWRPPRLSPLHYLDRLGLLLERTLIVHGNYLAADEMAALRRAGASVVFCPGSHRFFRYGRYPLAALRAAGVNVALGTDSLASNEALDIFREMNLVRREFPSVPPREVFAMGTRNGARALGWEDEIGALLPGKQADFLVLALRPWHLSDEDLYDAATAGRPRLVARFIGGVRVRP